MNLSMPITQALVSNGETINRCRARAIKYMDKKEHKILDQRRTLTRKTPIIELTIDQIARLPFCENNAVVSAEKRFTETNMVVQEIV